MPIVFPDRLGGLVFYSSLPASVRFATNGEFRESMQYRYDSMGNIIEVSENGRMVCRYEYDALNRLTREDNVAFSKTTTWVYDNNGNILARYEYDITTKPTNELHLLDCETFEYGYADNSDQLMSYNGESFVYDRIGNPTTYRGKTATWAYGRQLTEYDGNTFAYDARGRRIAKNDIVFTYDSNGNLIKQSNGLEFLYDHTGVFAIKHGDATYFYRKNAQNDIVALLDNNGAVVVKYKYDAWGNCQTTVVNSDASTIANLNPFRYRSYYFDTETGFYFLKTRYYDPEIGRFMTIDDISYLDPESINGLNLYAYSFNNPTKHVDHSGNFATTTFLICLGIGIVVGGALGYFSAKTQGTNVWFGLLTGALLGGIIGAGVGLALAGTAGGIAATIGRAFVKAGVKTIFNKFTADVIANVMFGKPMGSINSYMSAFVFGGLTNSLIKSDVVRKFVDVIGRPAYNIVVDDFLFKGKLPDSQKSWLSVLEKYAINVLIRGLTSPLSQEFKPQARGVLNGVYYMLKNMDNNNYVFSPSVTHYLLWE